jgi:hypothetical protein
MRENGFLVVCPSKKPNPMLIGITAVLLVVM